MKFQSILVALAVLISLSSCKPHDGVEVGLNDQDSPDAKERPTEHKNTTKTERDDELELAIRNAESGLPDDLYAVAKIYAQRVKDHKASSDQLVHWLEKAARLGHQEAQVTIAGMYHLGVGVPRNPELARYWFSIAADAGNPQAIYYLGLMTVQGDGGARDLEQGISLLEKAANRQVSKAMSFLGHLYDKGTEGLPSNREKSLAWLEKAARLGEPDAAELLGKIYYQGLGVDKNPTLAFRWYRMAAEQGAPHAQYITGLMLLEGEGTDKNPTQGVSWLKLAAGQDHVDAMGILAMCYSSGIGVTVDPEIARVWKERALKLQQDRSEKNRNN